MSVFTPSLLSPARDLSVGIAAIAAGADAVYIGGPAFGARQAAGNSLEDIAALCAHAHRYGVQVLVTLNTLLSDDERHQAARMAWQLHEVGTDALIIQDLRLLQEKLPPIRLHASTQCDNRTAEQVLRLRDLGFQRVVLARELSIGQIQTIHEAVPDMELEAFIHGALCVCYSGRCYLSEALQGRSANRGCCAQPCRMAYDLLDAKGNVLTDEHGQPIRQQHVLSLQDMDRSAYIARLMDAGVTTFKIEGRLKNADYVTNVTAYYRQHIDAVLRQRNLPARTDTQPIHYAFIPDPERTFHRGATDYFMDGRTRPMANWLTPKSTGQCVGKVVDISNGRITAELLPGVELHNGDGLNIGQEGFAVNAVEEVKKQMVRIRPNTLPASAKTGLLYRNLDTAFIQQLQAIRKIRVDICLEATQEGFTLTYTRMDNSESVTGNYRAEHQLAKDAQKAALNIRTQLSKLGDTIFVANKVRLPSDNAYFIPIKTLNQWRRDLTEHL